jgi:hypothetical protein
MINPVLASGAAQQQALAKLWLALRRLRLALVFPPTPGIS